MIIKSNFKDYYDGCSAYGDRNTIFIRNRVFVKNNEYKEIGMSGGYFDSEKNYESIKYQDLKYPISRWCCFGIGGDVYPAYFNYNFEKQSLNQYPEKIIFDPNHMDHNEFWCGNNFLSHKDNFDRIKSFFSNQINCNTFFDRFGPIFVIHSDWSNSRYFTKEYGCFTVERNPILKHYGFQKFMSPIEIYNKIERFLQNRANPPKNIPEMSNDNKIELHGFNLKTSFRKGK